MYSIFGGTYPQPDPACLAAYKATNTGSVSPGTTLSVPIDFTQVSRVYLLGGQDIAAPAGVLPTAPPTDTMKGGCCNSCDQSRLARRVWFIALVALFIWLIWRLR